MKSDYSRLPNNDHYRIFKTSKFAGVLSRRIASLELRDSQNWVACFVPVTDESGDCVSIYCKNTDTGSSVSGTPQCGEYLFPNRAYGVYENQVDAPIVEKTLMDMEEFLVRVKDISNRMG